MCFSELNKEQENIAEIEYILLWNLTPSKYDEAVSLIPSLRERPKDQVEHIIETLNKYKQ